jgi:hypothetical protein
MLEMNILFPGREVKLTDEITAEVFPIGLEQIKRYSSKLIDMLETLFSNLKIDGSADLSKFSDIIKSQLTDSAFRILLPRLLSDAIELLSECVMLRINREEFKDQRIPLAEANVPHHYMIKIAEVWFHENFTREDVIEPWKIVMTGLVEQQKKLN